MIATEAPAPVDHAFVVSGEMRRSVMEIRGYPRDKITRVWWEGECNGDSGSVRDLGDLLAGLIQAPLPDHL